ncbi:PTS transporter subunit EIIC, partial [Enterococcus faecalis]|uniref:PTS transporter subunit EIIC n=1 Tax=Enterococcus faecalis TaxID=1351 RepID=UPI003D6A4261
FVGVVTSIISVEIYRVTDKSKFKITMPDNVPPPVARSFESLTPTLIVMLLIGSITYNLGFDWDTFVGNLVGPLVQA